MVLQTSLDIELLPETLAIIEEFGKTVVLTTITKGFYDPKTQATTGGGPLEKTLKVSPPSKVTRKYGEESTVKVGDLKIILRAVSWREETAPPVIAKVHKKGKAAPDPLRGRYKAKVGGKTCVVEYEPDSDLRDTEQVPLLEPGGIEAFIRREVLPYTPDAWIKGEATKIGYEISFTRHFYKPTPLRTLEEIRADILTVEQEAEGLLDGLLKAKEGSG